MKYRNLFFTALFSAYVHGVIAAVADALGATGWHNFGVATAVLSICVAVVFFIMAAVDQNDERERARVLADKQAEEERREAMRAHDLETRRIHAETMALQLRLKELERASASEKQT